MKATISLLIASVGIAAAGTAPKQIAIEPIDVAPSYGVGQYFSLQGGINAYQNYEGTIRRTIGGESYALEAKEKIGGVGGIKWGYGWDGETVKPAIELDAFYNGVDVGLDLRDSSGSNVGSATARFDTGAFLINGILRFDTDSAFLPYLGVGIGGWVGQTEDTRVTIGGSSARISDNDTNGDLAAQAIAGCDYFYNDTTSIYIEYKYLNYWGADLPSDDPVQQHIVVAGLKWFF
ncbi:outer membrane protein [Sulfuriroseicoccus oceanibius]|uniref:Outer membrane beta-barrel protein n=1 Tax=Sulfuriroseicoccus oceanibius TaxID=2707525 RepID=A0A6B3LBN5_9BACT|nr:outer membrane beta-barrel protein [Sulfuriroseicoccus oceanibius]QQL46066.1 outer membrane beta-barrel protein [Sulfuriroseicoccus oceanibius]